MLHPPLFPGRVSSELEAFHNDPDLDTDADDEYEEWTQDKFGEEEDHGKEQGGEPPKLSEEELNTWDEEASLEELNRLSKLGVIEEVAEADYMHKENKYLDLPEVYDRIVARE